MAKRKAKDITEQEWQEIIEYAKANTITAASVKFNVYADSIKYKIDPSLREKAKQRANKTYANTKADPEKWKKRQEYNKQQCEEHKEERSEYHKKWLRENWDERQEYCKHYYNDNKSEIRLKSIQKYEELKSDSEKYEEYRQKCAEQRSKYRTREYKDAYNAKCRELYATSNKKRAKCFIYSSLNRIVKFCKQRINNQETANRMHHSIEYLGCTIDEFISHIESQFQPGMSWDNYGEWQIDHIMPLSMIDEKSDIEPQLFALCNYKNCKPLWAYDNNSKNDSIILNFIYPLDQLISEYKEYNIKSGDYNARANSCKNVLHFQPHFYSRANDLLSIKSVRDQIINNRETILKKPYYELTQEEILNGLKYANMYNAYSHFSPLWFKAFIQEYNIRTCYDPCGGWGHRLLGAQNLELYVYNDAWDKTYNGINDMINVLGITNTHTYNNDCSTFTPNESYEAIFTCPPYYNLELYDNKNRFKSEKQFQEWWESTLQHALKLETKVLGIVTDKYTLELLQPITDKYIKCVKQQSVGITRSEHNKQILTIYNK